jgi:ABC-type multidrug transport system fused ATPase/permease subunit
MPRINGASLSSVINADALSDEEARQNVTKFFGSLLALLLVVDVVCAFLVVWMQCGESNNHDSSMGSCIATSIFKEGFRFHPIVTPHDSEADYSLGDLFNIAIFRCCMTSLLLFYGLKYGTDSSAGDGDEMIEQEEEPTTTTDTNTDSDALTEPLLNGGEIFEDEPPSSTTTTTNTTKKRRLTPAQTKTAVQITMFITSTLYQVYAGLKVATMEHDHNDAKTLLLCLSVLWINAQAYVFGTLIKELTRENGLFLPPEVHRHPLYLEPNSNRSMSLHWCDLCHRRMSQANGGDGDNHGCFRCPLCDFDICLKCAKRKDAATVGENVLRGDRGVRAETALTTTGYFKRTVQIAQSELPWLLVSFGLLGLSCLSRLFLPHFQGRIIDKVIPKDNDGHYDKEGFIHYITLYLWLMVIQGAISTLYSAIFTLVSRRLKFTIRNALLEKILVQDVAYFDGTESGRLISRLTNDLDLMMAPIQSSLSSLLSNVLILIGGMVMCFAKSYRLSMLAFVTVGPISYLWDQYAMWSRGLAREMLSYWAEGNSIASQALSHIRTVKAFGCEDKVLKKYSETNKKALDCGIKDAWGNGITSALTGYLDLGSGVLILYFGGLLVYRGEMTVGDLVTYQLFWNLMNGSYQSLQGLVTTFTRSAAGAEKVFSLWDADPDIDPKKGTDINVDQVQGHLQLQNVKFFYQMRPDNIVLKEFNLDIPAGKTMALVGRSGGGKSTIINLLLRFYDPKEGKITLDGKDYDSLKVHHLRRLFGVVTQETELFALTVEENIAYGMDESEYTLDDVKEAAKKAFAHEFISEMKDGYQTRIGERGNRLSGGQRQRLAIARVFLRRPKIILLDEATSALDENSQEKVQQALANLIEESNATVVLVAHRLSTVVNADSICVVDKGTVLEQGNHDELVSQGGIYASMVSMQSSKKADLLDQEQQEGAAKEIEDLQREIIRLRTVQGGNNVST